MCPCCARFHCCLAYHERLEGERETRGGGMPTSAMTEPPKGAKARKMPAGEMR
jgi:hypothetical protein